MDRRVLFVLCALCVVVFGGLVLWPLWGSELGPVPSANGSPPGVRVMDDAAPDGAAPERDRVPVSPAPQAAEELACGSVTFLELPGRRPAVLDGWRMRRQDSEWEPVRGGAGGRIALQCAFWEFEPCEPYDAAKLSVDLRYDPTQVVWVRTRSNLTVRVVSRADGAPVQAAVVQHAPYPDMVGDRLARSIAPGAWSNATTTGSSGDAHLAGVLPPCVVRVVARGYEPVLLDIDGDDSPIQVALDPESTTGRAVMVVDAERGMPVPSVSVRAWCGAIGVEPMPDGGFDVKVPSTLTPDDRLVFTATGFAPTSVPLHRLSDDGNGVPKVVVHRDCSLVLDASADAQATWLVRLRAEPVDGDVAAPYEASVSVRGEQVVRMIPVGVTLEVLARTADGTCTIARMRTQPGVNRLRLVPGDSTLRIRVTTSASTGAAGDVPAPRSVARVKVRDMPAFAVFAADGVLCIPFAERVSSVQVRTPGFETVRLRRVGDESTNPGGVLALHLRRTWPVSLRLRDAVGRRQVGLRVLVIGNSPESKRSAPSSHPAWIVQHQPPQPSVTDGTGTALLHLVDGDYQGLLAPAGDLLGGRQCNLYAADPITFGVRGASVCDVVVDPPRRLLVRATDAFTGLPVASCRIHAGARVDLAPVSGAHRAVWIPQSCTSLQIDAPGYDSAVAQVPKEGALDVPLYPGGTGALTIESPGGEELVGARITVRCREPKGHRVSVAVVLRAPGSVPIHIPGARGKVTIDDLEWSGSEWHFEPVQSSWTAGGHLVFRAVSSNRRK